MCTGKVCVRKKMHAGKGVSVRGGARLHVRKCVGLCAGILCNEIK